MSKSNQLRSHRAVLIQVARCARPLLARAFMALAVLVSGCSDEAGHHHGNPAGADIAAPTHLAAMPARGGVHLTWTDNSNNEDMFMVMRKTGDGAYAELGVASENVSMYHDATATSQVPYTYLVHAICRDQSSPPSNEVSITLP